MSYCPSQAAHTENQRVPRWSGRDCIPGSLNTEPGSSGSQKGRSCSSLLCQPQSQAPLYHGTGSERTGVGFQRYHEPPQWPGSLSSGPYHPDRPGESGETGVSNGTCWSWAAAGVHGNTRDPSVVLTLTSRVKVMGLGILLLIVRLPDFSSMMNVSSVFPGRIWGVIRCLVPLL